MGTSCGGIAIKTNTKEINPKAFLNTIFDDEFAVTEPYPPRWQNEGYYHVYKTNEFLVIYNSEMSFEIFSNQPSQTLKKINHYLNTPEFIFAFEEYDSGDTYSYALIEEGKIVRKYSYHNEDILFNIGTPDAVESKWDNARTEIKYYSDDEGDFEKLYFNPEDESEFYNEHNLPQVKLHDLMLKKLGFTNHSLEDVAYETLLFKLASLPEIGAEQPHKKWWEFWK